jgi:hypothetical protein
MLFIVGRPAGRSASGDIAELMFPVGYPDGSTTSDGALEGSVAETADHAVADARPVLGPRLWSGGEFV